MHGFSENLVYVPGFLGLASKDESSESDDSESDEEGNESDADEETTPVENKNCKCFSLKKLEFVHKNLNFAMKSCKEIDKIHVCKGGAWERVDEVVSERLEIDANSRFMVTYNSDNDIVKDHQSDLANHKSKQVVGSIKHKKPSVFGEVKRLASKDESSESNDESSESDKEVAMDGNNQIPPLAYEVGKSETFRS
nr:hypothetical protein [Tanacetum cinerariifolium]